MVTKNWNVSQQNLAYLIKPTMSQHFTSHYPYINYSLNQLITLCHFKTFGTGIYIYTSNFCQVRNILWRNMIHEAWVDEWLGHGLFIIDKTLMTLVYARYPPHVLGCLDVCPRTDVSSVCLLHLFRISVVITLVVTI